MDTDYNTLLGQMINSPFATPSDRERMVALLLREHDSKFVTKEQIKDVLAMAEVMKKDFFESKERQLKEFMTAHPAKGIDAFPEPKQTYEFLSLFTKNDGGLKNLTHDFNYGYIEYDDFIKNCRHEFEEAKRRFPKVPKSLVRRIEEFAFSDTPKWFIREGKVKKEIEEGWSKPSFIEWYKENKIHPSKDTLYNNEMIIPFKESIQVRADTGNLLRMINRLSDLTFGTPPCCKVQIMDSVKNAQFYTNVDNLGQAIYQIFSTTKYFSEKNFCDTITIDYHIEKEMKILSFCHENSNPTKNASDKDYLGGDTTTIKTSLSGLCNYEIIANFPDGTFRKIILSDNYEEFKKGIIPIDKLTVRGYTHVLKFY